MTHSALSLPAAGPSAEGLASLPATLLRRERGLALAGFALLALMAPTLVAFQVDARTLSDVSVWM